MSDSSSSCSSSSDSDSDIYVNSRTGASFSKEEVKEAKQQYKKRVAGKRDIDFAVFIATEWSQGASDDSRDLSSSSSSSSTRHELPTLKAGSKPRARFAESKRLGRTFVLQDPPQSPTRTPPSSESSSPSTSSSSSSSSSSKVKQPAAPNLEWLKSVEYDDVDKSLKMLVMTHSRGSEHLKAVLASNSLPEFCKLVDSFYSFSEEEPGEHDSFHVEFLEPERMGPYIRNAVKVSAAMLKKSTQLNAEKVMERARDVLSRFDVSLRGIYESASLKLLRSSLVGWARSRATSPFHLVHDDAGDISVSVVSKLVEEERRRKPVEALAHVCHKFLVQIVRIHGGEGFAGFVARLIKDHRDGMDSTQELDELYHRRENALNVERKKENVSKRKSQIKSIKNRFVTWILSFREKDFERTFVHSETAKLAENVLAEMKIESGVAKQGYELDAIRNLAVLFVSILYKLHITPIEVWSDADKNTRIHEIYDEILRYAGETEPQEGSGEGGSAEPPEGAKDAEQCIESALKHLDANSAKGDYTLFLPSDVNFLEFEVKDYLAPRPFSKSGTFVTETGRLLRVKNGFISNCSGEDACCEVLPQAQLITSKSGINLRVQYISDYLSSRKRVLSKEEEEEDDEDEDDNDYKKIRFDHVPNRLVGIPLNQSRVVVKELHDDEMRKRVPRADGREFSSPAEIEAAGYQLKWMKDREERERILNDDPDYRFARLVAGFSFQEVTRLFNGEDFLRVRRAEISFEQQMKLQAESNTLSLKQLQDAEVEIKKKYDTLLTELTSQKEVLALWNQIYSDFGHRLLDYLDNRTSPDKSQVFADYLTFYETLSGQERQGAISSAHGDLEVLAERFLFYADTISPIFERFPFYEGELNDWKTELFVLQHTTDQGEKNNVVENVWKLIEKCEDTMMTEWIDEEDDVNNSMENEREDFSKKLHSPDATVRSQALLAKRAFFGRMKTYFTQEALKTNVDNVFKKKQLIEKFPKFYFFVCTNPMGNIQVATGAVNPLTMTVIPRDVTPAEAVFSTGLFQQNALSLLGRGYLRADREEFTAIVNNPPAPAPPQPPRVRGNREEIFEAYDKSTTQVNTTALFTAKTAALGEEVVRDRVFYDSVQRPLAAPNPDFRDSFFLEFLLKLVDYDLKKRVWEKKSQLDAQQVDLQTVRQRVNDLLNSKLKLTVPEVPYQHTYAYMSAPQQSGVMYFKEPLVAALSKAHEGVCRIFNLHPFDVDVEELQRNELFQSDFAQLVAAEMLRAGARRPVTYVGDSTKRDINTNLSDVAQNMRKRYTLRPYEEPFSKKKRLEITRKDTKQVLGGLGWGRRGGSGSGGGRIFFAD